MGLVAARVALTVALRVSDSPRCCRYAPSARACSRRGRYPGRRWKFAGPGGTRRRVSPHALLCSQLMRRRSALCRTNRRLTRLSDAGVPRRWTGLSRSSMSAHRDSIFFFGKLRRMRANLSVMPRVRSSSPPDGVSIGATVAALLALLCGPYCRSSHSNDRATRTVCSCSTAVLLCRLCRDCIDCIRRTMPFDPGRHSIRAGRYHRRALLTQNSALHSAIADLDQKCLAVVFTFLVGMYTTARCCDAFHFHLLSPR